MKKLFLLFTISIFISGCIDSPSVSADKGTLSLQIQVGSSDSRFSTISPKLDIERYIIDFESYNGDTSDKEDITLTESTDSISLAIGVWDFSIYAEDSDGIRIAVLSLEGIDVIKGESSVVEAILLPVSGTGSISITLDLSSKPDETTIDSVTYTLEKGLSSSEAISSGKLSAPYLLELSELESGTDYHLAYEITTDSDDVISSEGIIYVFADITTTDTVSLTAADFGAFSINVSPPEVTEKLVFIHHSCGNAWLSSWSGDLGNQLSENNYYVRDTYYEWEYYNGEEMEDIGSYTDTQHWLIWFGDPDNPVIQNNGELRRDNIMSSLYTTDNQRSAYTPINDPGGENDIIMFKSCYPLSEVGDDINDEKETYNKILDYFGQRQDKLFILITPPGKTIVTSYENTKELCQWLVDEENGWLAEYQYKNVGVFDFYCMLSEIDSHHTVEDGEIFYEYASSYDGTSPYHDGDDHPSDEGNRKATTEFIPLLNYYYNRWQGN